MTTGPSDAEAEPRGSNAESLADRVIAPFLREPTLWPIMLVLVAHGVMAMAMALLATLRTGSGFGLLSLVGLIGGSLVALGTDLRRGRLGLTSRCLAVWWALSILLAWGADRSGLY